MKLSRVRLVFLVAIGSVGCQMIAGLEVPRLGGSGGGGAVGATGGAGGAGGGGGRDGGGGDGACAPLRRDGGAACTFAADNAGVPCPEHLVLWLDADDACSLDADENGDVRIWKDRSGFGWTATNTAAKMKAVTSDGRRTVQILPPGMTLTPPGADGGPPPSFAPAGFIMAGAFRWDVLGTGDYGESDALCLGSTRYGDRLQFGTQKAGGQESKALLRVTNDDSRRITMNQGGVGDAGSWLVLMGGYSCGANCPDPKAPDSTLGVNGNQGPPDQTDGAPPSLVPRPQGDGWNGYWNASLIGMSCDGRDTMTGEIGEILVYDAYLDGTELQRVYAYLSQRWP